MDAILLRVGAASLVAGPVLVTAAALAHLYLRLPAPILIPAEHAAGFVAILLASTVAGFIPAFTLNLVGASLMTLAARQSGFARTRVAWALAGAALGSLLATAFGAGAEARFGLVAASIVCALVCRVGAEPD